MFWLANVRVEGREGDWIIHTLELVVSGGMVNSPREITIRRGRAIFVIAKLFIVDNLRNMRHALIVQTIFVVGWSIRCFRAMTGCSKIEQPVSTEIMVNKKTRYVIRNDESFVKMSRHHEEQ
jgi:hypothetical protein